MSLTPFLGSKSEAQLRKIIVTIRKNALNATLVRILINVLFKGSVIVSLCIF